MRCEITGLHGIKIIDLEPITQVCGTEIVKRNIVINDICSYFSSVREVDSSMSVSLDGEVVGRKHYYTYRISTKESLLSTIKISKKSLMMEYIDGFYDEYENMLYINKIDENLNILISEINKRIVENGIGVELTYTMNNLLSIIQKMDLKPKHEDHFDNMSCFDLLTSFLSLLEKRCEKNPEDILCVIENIDHMISVEEYHELIKRLKELTHSYPIYFVISISIDGFVYVDEEVISGINVVNDDIFTFDSLEVLGDYLQRNYPIMYEFQETELMDVVRDIANHICENHSSINMKSLVVRRLIQNEMGYRFDVIGELGKVENCLLKGR